MPRIKLSKNKYENSEDYIVLDSGRNSNTSKKNSLWEEKSEDIFVEIIPGERKESKENSLKKPSRVSLDFDRNKVFAVILLFIIMFALPAFIWSSTGESASTNSISGSVAGISTTSSSEGNSLIPSEQREALIELDKKINSALGISLVTFLLIAGLSVISVPVLVYLID